MVKDSHAGDLGKGFLKKFQPLRTKIGVDVSRSGDVPTWSGEAPHKPRSYEIASTRDNWDRGSRLLGSKSRLRACRDNDIHPKADQLGCKFRVTVEFPLSRSILD